MNANNSKLKGKFWCSRRNCFGTWLLWNNLTCAITPNGLNACSIESGNIELYYTLKLAWVIHAAVFWKTLNTANLKKWGLGKFNFAASRKYVKLHNLSFLRRCLMLDDGFKLKWSVDLKELEGKEKIIRYWCYRCELSVQTTTKRDI